MKPGTVPRSVLERYSGDPETLGGVRLVVLDNGQERGLRVLEFRTGGGLRFDVVVDRAMDIGAAEFDDVSIGWRSATGLRHPSLHENADEQGLAWLRSFSGLLVTGGLDHTLTAREVDASRYAYPPRRTVRHPLHGRVANLPAHLIGFGRRWDDDLCVLWAEGEVRQAAVFGEHLVLTRRIEAVLGGAEIRIHDTVRNAGFESTPHRFLYHVNLGWPLIENGTRLDAAIEKVLWASPGATVDPRACEEPQHGFVEQVFAHELRPDGDGVTRVRVVNDRLQLGFELNYRAEQFPHFMQWLNFRSGSYGVALEPTTHGPDSGDPDGPDEPAFLLGHGESREYTTVFRFGELGGSAASEPSRR